MKTSLVYVHIGTNIPDYLFAEIEQAVLKDLTMQITVPSDVQDDKINPLR